MRKLWAWRGDLGNLPGICGLCAPASAVIRGNRVGSLDKNAAISKTILVGSRYIQEVCIARLVEKPGNFKERLLDGKGMYTRRVPKGKLMHVRSHDK